MIEKGRCQSTSSVCLFPQPPEEETRERDDHEHETDCSVCTESHEGKQESNDGDHEHDLATDPKQQRRGRLLLRGVSSGSRSLSTTRGHVRDPCAWDPDSASLSPGGAHAGAKTFPTKRDTRRLFAHIETDTGRDLEALSESESHHDPPLYYPIFRPRIPMLLS